MNKLLEIGRKLARPIGFLLSTIALVTFLYVLAKMLGSADIRSLAERHWSTLLIALLVYCIAYVPMTLAWTSLARSAGAQASNLTLVRVLLVSQIGKYLPGNVAQFLGRAYYAREYGVPLASTGLAIALELAGILAASGLLAGSAIALGWVGPRPDMSGSVIWVSSFAGFVALVGSFWIVRSKGIKVRTLLGPLVRAVGYYVLVLGLLAAANVILVAEIGGAWSTNIVGEVASAFLVGWLVGFVTPGSPAGLGLRELSFLVLLSGSVPQDVVLIAAAGFRVVTIFGDLAAWFIGILLPATNNKADAPEPLPI